eukprot:1479696-Amphidinium_carterae.1
MATVGTLQRHTKSGNQCRCSLLNAVVTTWWTPPLQRCHAAPLVGDHHWNCGAHAPVSILNSIDQGPSDPRRTEGKDCRHKTIRT